MTAISARSRQAGPRRSAQKILRDMFGRKLGSAALLCRWSRVLGHLNDTAAAGCRTGC